MSVVAVPLVEAFTDGVPTEPMFVPAAAVTVLIPPPSVTMSAEVMTSDDVPLIVLVIFLFVVS